MEGLLEEERHETMVEEMVLEKVRIVLKVVAHGVRVLRWQG